MNTLADLRRWAADAPPGTSMPASALVELLDGLDEAPLVKVEPKAIVDASWRERLWTVPAETRLGVADVAEALGRPKSFVYARTGNSEHPLPHRKLDGSLVFTAGELRAWIRDHEEVVHAGPFLSVKRGDAA